MDVVPIDDVADPLPADAVALDVGAGVFAGTADPGADVVTDERAESGDDVLPPGVELLELIDDGSGDVGGVCNNSTAMPLLASTDPVWMLEMGLQGVGVMLVGGGGLGGATGAGFDGTCATAVDAHAMPIQMNRGRFIGNLLYRSAVRFQEIPVQGSRHATVSARQKSGRAASPGTAARLPCRY